MLVPCDARRNVDRRLDLQALARQVDCRSGLRAAQLIDGEGIAIDAVQQRAQLLMQCRMEALGTGQDT